MFEAHNKNQLLKSNNNSAHVKVIRLCFEIKFVIWTYFKLYECKINFLLDTFL